MVVGAWVAWAGAWRAWAVGVVARVGGALALTLTLTLAWAWVALTRSRGRGRDGWRVAGGRSRTAVVSKKQETNWAAAPEPPVPTPGSNPKIVKVLERSTVHT